MRLIWDAVRSCCIRAIFTIALASGVNALVWTYDRWRTNFWKDNPENARLGFVLFAILAVVGAIGTFRRRARDDDVSLLTLGALAAGTATGHVHLPVHNEGGRSMRRRPIGENLLIGTGLIALWLFRWIWQGDHWVFRNAAIIGLVQILWATALFYARRRRVLRSRNPEVASGPMARP